MVQRIPQAPGEESEKGKKSAVVLSCQEAVEKMPEALDSFAAPELLQHLASCESCLARWRALEAVHSLLQSYPDPLPLPPATLKTEVMAAIRKEVAARKAFKVAGAFLLVFSIGVIMALSLSYTVFTIRTILPFAESVLEITLRWFWHWRVLLELLLELAMAASRVVAYSTAALLVLAAIFVNLIKRRFRHEMA